MDTSATGVTVVGSLDVLLLVLGSEAVPVTTATLVTPGAAAAPTETIRVIELLAPEVRPPALEATTVEPPEPVKSQPVPLPETKVSPVGSVSVSDSVPDGEGP